jgi:hypothetical protein
VEVQSWLSRARTHAPVLFLIHTGNAHLLALNHLGTAEAAVQKELRNTTTDTRVFKPHALNDFVVKEHYQGRGTRMPGDVSTALYVLQYKHDLALIRNVMAAKANGTRGLPERMTLLPTATNGEDCRYSNPVWKENCGLDWDYIV